MKIILRTLLVLTGIYIFVCMLANFNQESLLFHPVTLPNAHKYRFYDKFTEFNFDAGGNKKLNGLFFPADNAKGTVLFFHGNAGNMTYFEEYYREFVSLGYNCATYDYRGFGKSQGTISSEQQFYDDAAAFAEFVREEFPSGDVIVCGFSLGTAAATRIALERKASKLILLAPYFSMVSLASEKYPVFPSMLLKYRFETEKDFRKLEIPVLLVHGRNDGTIPSSHSEKLCELNKKHSKPVIENAAHTNLLDNAKVRSEINAFLD